MKKWIILVVVFLLSYFLYQKRDIFRSTDTLQFTDTPVELLKNAKVFAVFNTQDSVEYKNGTLFDGLGKPILPVSNGQKRISFSKKYKHADFFIVVNDKYFCSDFSIDKEDENTAFDIGLELSQKDSVYSLSGYVEHNNREIQRLGYHPLKQFSNGFKISYYRNKELEKKEWKAE